MGPKKSDLRHENWSSCRKGKENEIILPGGERLRRNTIQAWFEMPHKIWKTAIPFEPEIQI